MVALPPPDLLELFYDGQWNARTGDVRASAGVAMSRGVKAEGTRAEPSSADMLLNNRHGDYSRRNPTSALYDKIGPNTPMRYSVDAGHPYLLLPGDTTSALTTPDDAVLGVTDLDLRIEVALDDYSVSKELASRFSTTGDNRAWSFQLPTLRPQLSWYPDGTFASQKVANAPDPLPDLPRKRIALRVVLDVDDGSGGHLVSFYWAPTINATVWNSLGTDSDGAGTTTLIDGTAGLSLGTNTGIVGNGVNGRVYALQLYDAATSTLKVDLDFSTAQAGDTSFTDPGGLVWTVAGSAALANRHIRMAGEVPAWPPELDPSGSDRTVPITPAGITRRLGAGKRPLESALLRYIRAASPIDCWPLTDGQQSTAATSLVNGAVMTPFFSLGGPITWAQGQLAEWVEPVLQVPAGSDATMRGQLPDSIAAASGWSAEFVVASLLEGSVSLQATDRGAASDADNRLAWNVSLEADTDEIFVDVAAIGATSSSVSALATIASPGIFDDQPHHIRLTITPQPGSGNTAWELFVDGTSVDDGTYAVVSKAPLSVRAGWFQNAVTGTTPSIGFVTCWDSTGPDADDMYDALFGFQGERAGDRFLRLCAEQGVPAVLHGDTADTTALGVQQLETFLDALASIARADHGYALEQRDEAALLYRTRTTLYNQDPALTLDYSTGVISAPFKPLDDDLRAENDVIVQREGGTFGRASRETIAEGPKSVEAIGRYDVSHDLSLAADSQALQHAGWLLHLGTADGLRYTQITLNLGNPRVQALARDIYLADVGDKIRLTSLPDDHGPDDIDLIIRGYKETVSETKWLITFNCTPAAPYDVLQLDAGEYSRLDTGGSELVLGIDTTATSLPVATTGLALWTTDSGDLPFDIAIGGERMTVTAVTGAAQDTFTRSVANGWGTADSGQAWTRAGGSAADFSVNGTVGQHSIATLNAPRSTTIPVASADTDTVFDWSLSVVPTGDNVFINAMARRVDGNDFYYARVQIAAGGAMTLTIRKMVAGVDTQLATYATGLTYVAATLYSLRFTLTGDTLSASVWPAANSEPPTPQATATDTSFTAAGLFGFRTQAGASLTNTLPITASMDNLTATPQLMTVTRSANGVIKSHSAGAKVGLAKPVVLPL
ncbi:hypothetical protein ACFUJR_27700 [Streptomyces sp. NPDC057271]|uniref:hypothetical protein n=1 Tax=unclassified Streptomyces TaxID=2593676 RepID=UPI003632A252